MRLFSASVGPSETWAWCQAAIWCRQRVMVRPSWWDLGRARVVLQVAAEPADEGEGEVGVVVVIDRSDDLFGVPGGADLVSGIAGIEQTEQLGARGHRGVRPPW
jgi:hypothetical protein